MGVVQISMLKHENLTKLGLFYIFINNLFMFLEGQERIKKYS